MKNAESIMAALLNCCLVESLFNFQLWFTQTFSNLFYHFTALIYLVLFIDHGWLQVGFVAFLLFLVYQRLLLRNCQTLYLKSRNISLKNVFSSKKVILNLFFKSGVSNSNGSVGKPRNCKLFESHNT